MTLDRTAARARCEAATEGPWEKRFDEEEYGHVIKMASRRLSSSRYQPQHEIKYEHNLFPEDGAQFAEADANTTFIAHARTDLPAALDELDAKDKHIATLEAQVEKAREALKKIEAKAPSQYEPSAEYWEWGNYDDAYAYGLDTATMRCAQIATAALQDLREGGDHAD